MCRDGGMVHLWHRETSSVLACSIYCNLQQIISLGYFRWNQGDRIIKCCLSRMKQLICISLLRVKFNGVLFYPLGNGKHDSLSNGKYNLLSDHIKLFPLFVFLHHALNSQNSRFRFWLQIMKSNFPGRCDCINRLGWGTFILSPVPPNI